MSAPPKLISGKHLEDYSRRKSVVDAFKTWTGTLTDFAALHKVPMTNVKRWVEAAAMGTDNLLDKRMNGGRKVTLPSKVAAWAFCYWTDHPKASLTTIHEQVSKMAEKEGMAKFSYKQIKTLFARTPTDMRKIIVDGERAGFEQAGIVARRVEGFPNEVWQMDATELDSWALDMSSGVWYRPWMTTIIDCYSRVILSAIFHRHEPTTADALIALQGAILPKGYADYPFFGLPKGLSCDNHSTYKSADFLDALRRLGITRMEIPNECPSADGKIERFFRTFKFGLLARLAGYAGQHKGLARAKKAAVPSALLPKIIRRFIVDYHLREHAGIGTTPWEKWHEGLEHAHGLVVNDSEIEDAIKLRRDFLIARDGIEVEPRRHFSGVCLGGLVDKTIQVLLSPQGRDREIPAYYLTKLIGTLKCLEEDATLADDVRAERLSRSVDIQRLAAGLRGQVENEGVTTESGEAESVPMTTEGGVQKIVVAELPTNVPIPPNTKPKKPVETKPKQLVLPRIKKHGDT